MLRRTPAALLLAASPLLAADAPAPTSPPFGDAPSPHTVATAVDTRPARGVLSILSGGASPAATLRELKASPSMARALAAEGVSPEDFFGRLVASAAGSPDALLTSYASRAGTWGTVLDAFDGKAFEVEARRVLSLLPVEPRLNVRMTLVPFFAVSGFSEVAPFSEGDDWTFVADLPRLAGESIETSVPREVMLKTVRAAGAAAWRSIFAGRWGSGAAWKEKGPDVDALLTRTVVEGPPMLFLIPDEFYPLDALFEEPIARAMSRWGAAVEALGNPKKKENERSDVLAQTLAGDFWGRSASVVGAVMTDAILRKAGREAYLKALASGPPAVVSLWLDVTRGTKLPQPPKSVRKELEKRLSESGGAAKG